MRRLRTQGKRKLVEPGEQGLDRGKKSGKLHRPASNLAEILWKEFHRSQNSEQFFLRERVHVITADAEELTGTHLPQALSVVRLRALTIGRHYSPAATEALKYHIAPPDYLPAFRKPLIIYLPSRFLVIEIGVR
jgi:hypothetical protein